MNAIECRDLTKSYQGCTLDHITFTLPAGCILGLVGENGAGKSTTLKLLMNATSREDGQVSLLGTDNQSPDFLQTKQDIGVVLDEACAAVNTGLLPLEDLLACLDSLECEVVLTGRDPAPELMERADYITSMEAVRHPFEQGITAREGIEF